MASRDAAWPGSTDSRLSACDAGDSVVCNQVGEEMWQQDAYTEARDWFTVSCARLDDVVASGQRMVALGAKAQAAQQVVEAAARGSRVSPDESEAALQTIENLRPEGAELKARIEGCIRVGDTHHMQYRHAAALPYFETVCKLRAIQPQVEPLIPGMQLLVTTACDASDFSRQAAAADAAARADVSGALVQGAPIAYQRAAAPTATAAPAPTAGPAATSALAATAAPAAIVTLPAALTAPVVCGDYGASCESDPDVLPWKQQCASDARSQAPCYCAVAATFECLIAHQCYAEAGARRADGQVSDTRLAALQQGARQNSARAQQLGKSCW